MTLTSDTNTSKGEVKQALVVAGLFSPFALIGILALYDQTHGDWALIGLKIAHGLLVAGAISAVVFGVGAAVRAIQGRPWRTWAPSLSEMGHVVLFAMWLSAFLARRHVTEPDARLRAPDAPLDWMTPVGYLLPGLLAAGLIVVLVRWWLGHVERDRARAAAKDRSSRGLSGDAGPK
jgi:hypothetical protein